MLLCVLQDDNIQDELLLMLCVCIGAVVDVVVCVTGCVGAVVDVVCVCGRCC